VTLPPGLSKREFANALAEFERAVGKDWVFHDPTLMETYRDAYAPTRDDNDEPIASAAVAPASVEEVQATVRIANKYRIPLWVVSTGRNFGYGGPAGVVPGSITVDLKRMNRIIEVNEKHAYALVEPGVSFFDLYRHIQANGIKLWLDVPYPGWGSLVGNTIEHGMGYTKYCDRMHFQCGMEVVLMNGEVVRTGMGALPQSKTWQTYKHSLGPEVDGLFYQTSLGIVTKVGMWLMPEPRAYISAEIHAPQYEDIVPLIDTMRPLRQSGVIDMNATLVNQPVGSSNDPDKLPSWYNRIAFYGSEKMVDLQWEEVMDAHAHLPGVRFEARRYKTPLNPSEMPFDDKLQAGIPTLHAWAHPIFFAPVLPFIGEEVLENIRLLDRIAKKYGRRYYGALHHAVSPRCIVPTPAAAVNRGDANYNRESVKMVNEWIQESAARGWGGYRAHTANMDETQAVYSFNNHALLRLQETLKDALDPNGIMSPGKNGIWPKHMRGKKS
jgi:(+)-pinoresinol hydroxylase